MNLLRVDAARCRPDDLADAVAWLRAGKIVAFPTDTFYGFAVDPTSDAAVHHLFDLKGRSARAALPLVAASSRQVEALCGPFGSTSGRLAAVFWPGPLSLVLDAPASVSVAVHGGSRTIAIRVPDHPVARALAEAWGAPLTATSANRTGADPAVDPSGLGSLGADPRVLVIDGGRTSGGAASTIVDARGPRLTLVREGAIAWSRVLESLNA
ncbi:MAG TPA: L-threonylcarbamoyladenylate synthase [Vicinamibacterales bacterium]|nr:L-threonylcarbamoyladenylate synthase [Vicinamibacterales bacterium]